MATLMNSERRVDSPLGGGALQANPVLRKLSHLLRRLPSATSGDERRTVSPKPRSRSISRPQPGDAVRHGAYGQGRVLAHWPDGTLLVRFHRMPRSRLVPPSHLGRLRAGER